MNPLVIFRRPEYFFRPQQILRRLRRIVQPPRPIEKVRLPWGWQLRVHPDETIGANIYAYGLFDLPVCEALRRLLDPGDCAVDIGANIGQMTSLMRHCAGPAGRVIAFEPHPEIFRELSANLEPLAGASDHAPVQLEPRGLSDAPGAAVLDVGPDWQGNRGMSRLVDTISGEGQTGRCVSVAVTTLDTYFPAPARIDVAKIDVEGHEAAVLRGGQEMFRARRVRDLVFEDFGTYPSAAVQFLESCGYRIFRLCPRWAGLELGAPGGLAVAAGSDYLATVDPERAAVRFAAPGWSVLRPPR